MVNLNRFDLNLLVALDMLLTERSVTRAAERLCVTQPALSGSLQRLRHYFGDQLLLRVGREMELTPKARALIDPVRAALLQVEGVLEVRALFDATTSDRSFRIAMSDYSICVFLPSIVRRLAAEAPNIRLIVETVFGTIFSRLEGGDIDLIVTHSDRRLFGRDEPDIGLTSEDLFQDDFVCVVAADHPVGTTLTLEEYRQYPHVLAYFGPDVKSIEDQDRERQSIQIKDQILVPTFPGMLYQLPGTQLIATVQRRLATALAPSLSIRLLEIPFEVAMLRETSIWHLRNDDDPGHRWLREMVSRVAQALN
jgi:DNA-binding transcriptional LysR family regulator